MSEKLGIDTLKRDVIIVCSLVTTTDKALADKKVSIIEGFNIAKDAVGLLQVARNWKDAREELADLTMNERQNLIDFIAETFELINDVAERWVETAVEVILSLAAAFEVQKAA